MAPEAKPGSQTFPIETLDESVRCRRLAMILDTSSDAMLAWDRDGRIVEANRAACALTRLTRRELLNGLSIEELLPSFPQPTERGAPVRARLELVLSDARQDGSELRLPVSVTMRKVDEDPLIVAHALIRDESQVVAAEREAASHLARIRLLEKELRTLLDNAPLIIFRLDPGTGHLLYLNRHAERLLGVPLDDALRSRDFIRAVHADADSTKAFDDALQRARQGERSHPYEARLRGPRTPGKGIEITVQSTIYPLLSDQENVTAIEGILVDVSAEHEARTRLVQADRLFTLGMIAAGVAHEINNPAAFLTLGLTQLERLFPQAFTETNVTGASGQTNLDVSTLISDLRASVERISLIARDLRLFANPVREETAQRTFVDVTHAVESALTLTRSQIMEHARIVLNLQPVPHVVMDDGRLGQVLVNLLVNAAQALSKQARHERVVTVTTRSDDEFVEIAIADTGTGIPQDMLERIWLPFFTTKGRQGTGLGLSISREIIEKSGGTIAVESPAVRSEHQSYGARFVVRLPLTGQPTMQSPSAASPKRTPSNRDLRVLIVDDERILARAVATELGRIHDVTFVHSGHDALEILSTGRFDVVLCDLRMPGMSGEALYSRLCERGDAHAGAFVFMTGVGFGAEVERFLRASGRPVLEKPFSIQQALQAIDTVIESAARPGEATP